MKIKYQLLISILLLISAAHAFDPYELPYGIYCTKDWFITNDLTALEDTLGINFVYGITDTSAVKLLDGAGYDIIKWGSPDPYNPSRASDYSYFKVEAEDFDSPIRFETQSYDSISNGFLVSNDSGIMVGDLWFGQYPTNAYRGEQVIGPKEFFIKVRLAIDAAGMTTDSLIGVIYVHRLAGSTWEERAAIPIYPDSALLAGDAVEAPADPISFGLCGQDSCAWDYKVKYSFWNSGATTVYLDYFKCYEDIGEEIVESTNLDSTIQAAVTGGWRDSVDLWWLRDEPRFDHFRTVAKVRGLVNDTLGRGASITAFLMTSVRASFDTTQMAAALRSFLQITGQERVVINDYPFTGGVNTSYFTDYTGYGEWMGQGDQPNTHRGLQKELELYSQKYFDLVSREVRDGNTLTEFWSSPQCYFQVCDSAQGYDPPNSMYIWRPPTQAESRVNAYFPLSYGAKGLALWMYHWGHSSDYWGAWCDPYSFGFYLSDSQRNTTMWNVFANDITPYLKAIDSVYMGLTWQRAYAYHLSDPSIQPPAEAFVSSIAAISNSPDSNPDLGWFHVGEFTDANGDPYVMLVNRACSRGPSDSTEAPSITATIRLNPDNIDIDSFAYVIDLAHTVVFDTVSDEWTAVPETIYTALMPDNYIPFTTTFRAGEGRLFKIISSAANLDAPDARRLLSPEK
jgi:hypothetical protein